MWSSLNNGHEEIVYKWIISTLTLKCTELFFLGPNLRYCGWPNVIVSFLIIILWCRKNTVNDLTTGPLSSRFVVVYLLNVKGEVVWALCNCIQQLLCHFEFLVLVIGDPCLLCDPRLYYYQMTGGECNTCPGYVPFTHFEVVMWFRIGTKKDQGPVVAKTD